MSKKKYRIKIRKPNGGYSGSLIQQNFGESESKGFLVWNISSKDEWDVEFHELKNRSPFVTIDWKGSIAKTIKGVEKIRGSEAFLPGARFRVSSSQNIPSIQARKLLFELKEIRGAADVVFKVDLISKMDHFSAGNLRVSKKGLRQDPDAIVRLYLNYISAHSDNYKFKKEQLDLAEVFIRGYMTQLMQKNPEDVATDVKWVIKTLEFDNIFGYGEKNYIDFTKLNGIAGIFGNNKIGKSSVIGALMFVLYNSTDRGAMKNSHIINRRKDYCKGSIKISVAGQDYIIERQTSRVIPKRKTKTDYSNKTTTTVNLYKIVWSEEQQREEKVEHNSISRDETDKVIKRLIGTKEDFLLTVLSSQGNIDNFIKEKTTERKNILARFLDLVIFKHLEELVKKDYNILEQKGSLISPENINAQIIKARKSIASHDQLCKEHDGRLLLQRQKKDEVHLWLMHHEKNAAEIDLAHLSKLAEQIEEDKESLELIKSEQEDAARFHSKLKKDLQKNKTIKKKIDISILRDQIDDLEIVKSTLQELEHEFSIQGNRLKTQKKNVRKLDLVPCEDSFPECFYIRDAHADKLKIEKQGSLVNKIQIQVESHQKKLDEFVKKKIQESIVEWQRLDREEFDLVTKLSLEQQKKKHIADDVKAIKKEIKKTASILKSLRRKINILEGKEYEAKVGQLKKIRETIQKTEDVRHTGIVKLGGFKESLSRLLLEQEETRAIIEELKIYDSIQSAFSKTGIPAMVLKSQLPTINQEITKILEGVVDFEVILETDISSNVMDIFIKDVHSKRIIELASGMEKTIASLALRVALTNLSSLPKSDMLIIDEGYGALDSEHIQSAINFLQSLKSQFKTILTVSHVMAIKECADIIIEIENDGLESRVRYPIGS